MSSTTVPGAVSSTRGENALAISRSAGCAEAATRASGTCMHANIVVHFRSATLGMTQPQDVDIQVGLGQQQSVCGTVCRGVCSRRLPCCPAGVHAKNHSCCRFRDTLAADQQQNRGSVLHNALKTEPDGKRNAAN